MSRRISLSLVLPEYAYLPVPGLYDLLSLVQLAPQPLDLIVLPLGRGQIG